MDCEEGWAPKNWCFWTVVLEKTLESPLDCKEIQPVHSKGDRSVLSVHWKDWCWSWNSHTLATSCEELTHWKKLSSWKRLGAGGEGDNRGWDGWMASPTQWMWVWVNSGSWWWTGRPGVLQFMGLHRVGHDWATELNWTGGSDSKEPAYSTDQGLIPGSGRSPGEGNSNSLQYSCLENPIDRGAWRATVHGLTKNRTRLSYIYLPCFHQL